jgi:hypothetical protein
MKTAPLKLWKTCTDNAASSQHEWRSALPEGIMITSENLICIGSGILFGIVLREVYFRFRLWLYRRRMRKMPRSLSIIQP